MANSRSRQPARARPINPRWRGIWVEMSGTPSRSAGLLLRNRTPEGRSGRCRYSSLATRFEPAGPAWYMTPRPRSVASAHIGTSLRPGPCRDDRGAPIRRGPEPETTSARASGSAGSPRQRRAGRPAIGIGRTPRATTVAMCCRNRCDHRPVTSGPWTRSGEPGPYRRDRRASPVRIQRMGPAPCEAGARWKLPGSTIVLRPLRGHAGRPAPRKGRVHPAQPVAAGRHDRWTRRIRDQGDAETEWTGQGIIPRSPPHRTRRISGALRPRTRASMPYVNCPVPATDRPRQRCAARRGRCGAGSASGRIIALRLG